MAEPANKTDKTDEAADRIAALEALVAEMRRSPDDAGPSAEDVEWAQDVADHLAGVTYPEKSSELVAELREIKESKFKRMAKLGTLSRDDLARAIQIIREDLTAKARRTAEDADTLLRSVDGIDTHIALLKIAADRYVDKGGN